MVDIIIYTLLVGVCGTGLGGVVGALFKKDSNATMSLLLSFAGGVMLSIVCFDLLSSSIESSNVFVAVAFVVIGIVLVFLLNFILDRISAKNNSHLDENHPKTHDDLDELIHSEALTNPGNTSLLRAGIIMVLAAVAQAVIASIQFKKSKKKYEVATTNGKNKDTKKDKKSKKDKKEESKDESIEVKVVEPEEIKKIGQKEENDNEKDTSSSVE